MSQVISVRDIQEMIRSGQGVNIPADAIVTPSARELLQDIETNGARAIATGAAPAAPASADKLSPPTKKLTSKSPKSELEAFFNSPYALNLKEQICAMGKRLWQREYVDGNGGNHGHPRRRRHRDLHAHVVSKGSLQPSDMCLVDFEATNCSAPRSAPAKS